jgi:hypothetical protein
VANPLNSQRKIKDKKKTPKWTNAVAKENEIDFYMHTGYMYFSAACRYVHMSNLKKL